ncbi:MAG: hypothetical protein PUC30_03615 [Lachnospiraceae bacterium]|nr:hypothetical protein [Lachnospiraceae bacterium]
MAEKKGKTTSQGRNHTTKRNGSSGKNTGRSNHKENSGPDLLTVIVVLVAVVLVLVLISKYTGDKEGNGSPTPTVTAPLTGQTGEDEPTKTVSPSDAPEATPSVTKPVKDEPDSKPTPTVKPVLSVEEAKSVLNKKIESDKYDIELLDDHLIIDGVEYYSFCITDKNGNEMEPLLIVDKEEGTLFCYDLNDGVSAFSKFPLDKTETGTNGEDIITAEEAKRVLAGYSKEALGLLGNVSDYEMTVDDWTTMASGVECYGINLFGPAGNLCGTYYVALNGSAVYSQDDETGEFIKR